MDNEELFKALRIVALTTKPEKTFFNDVRYEYKDSKITISRILSGGNASLNLKHIEVYIHSTVAGVIHAGSTRVYEHDAGQGDVYYRPGKWETYVINLATQIEKNKTDLNKTPIDDSDIFPDID